MDHTRRLGIVGEEPAERPPALPQEVATWLENALRDEGAPLVPVSDLEWAYQREGETLAGRSAEPLVPVRLLKRSRRRLFPPGRVKALHRWLLRRRRSDDPDDADADRCAGATLSALRDTDPLGRMAPHHPVLVAVLEASVEAVRRPERLRSLVAQVERSSWPREEGDDLDTFLPLLRQLPVRVPPVDLLTPLRELARRRSSPRGRETVEQLFLLDVSAQPLVGPTRLTRGAREALADRLAAWLRASRASAETATFAHDMTQRLRGAPGSDEPIEALMRVSALELPRRCSAAELTRLEAVLAAGRRRTAPLLEYGDYLARARRWEEAVRAYRRAREAARPEDRGRIDERIAARERRLAETPSRRPGRPADPAQLSLATLW